MDNLTTSTLAAQQEACTGEMRRKSVRLRRRERDEGRGDRRGTSFGRGVRRRGVRMRGEGMLVTSDACSFSQRAQQTVRRTHSGDIPAVASSKGISSQRTKASCVRMCKAAQAHCASGLLPFLRRSRVFRAVARTVFRFHDPGGGWPRRGRGLSRGSPPPGISREQRVRGIVDWTTRVETRARTCGKKEANSAH